MGSVGAATVLTAANAPRVARGPLRRADATNERSTADPDEAPSTCDQVALTRTDIATWSCLRASPCVAKEVVLRTEVNG